MSANLTLGPSALLLIRESQLARFRNIDVGPNARMIVLPETLPENWAQQLAAAMGQATPPLAARGLAGVDVKSPSADT